ncbi:MAG TPA: hypothetical protein PKA37_14965, partial [Planctomycetota bacterium]|nr:hypothetical protein [Planctomycetota bacterium]
GLVAWCLLIVFALRQIALALRSDQLEHRRLAPWIGGAFAAFLILTFLRSPLHHPCGALAPFLAIGTLLNQPNRKTPAVRSRRALLLTLPVLAVALVLELHDDQVLHQARRQQILGSEASKSGPSGILQIRESLGLATDCVRRLLAAPWLSHERAYRVALLARDLVQVRKELEAPAMQSAMAPLGWPPLTEWLPTDQEFARIIDRTLEMQPAHFAARLLQADMLLQSTRASGPKDQRLVAHLRADQILAEGMRLQPTLFPLIQLRAKSLAEAGDSRAARTLLERSTDALFSEERGRLLGELALTLGNDPSTFGSFLDLDLEGPEFTNPAPLSSPDVRDPVHGDERLHHALLHLGLHPTSQEALKVLADRAFDLSRGERPELAAWGNRAVARQRVLIHLEEGEEAPEARSRVVMALRRDPAFLDAHYLLARLAAREGGSDQAQESITALLERGVLAVDLERRIRTDSSLSPEARILLLSALQKPR